jgi:hypothetical protein
MHYAQFVLVHVDVAQSTVVGQYNRVSYATHHRVVCEYRHVARYVRNGQHDEYQQRILCAYATQHGKRFRDDRVVYAGVGRD